MRLAFRACAGVAGMALGIVAYQETRRLQRRSELCPNTISDTHTTEIRATIAVSRLTIAAVVPLREYSQRPNSR